MERHIPFIDLLVAYGVAISLNKFGSHMNNG